MYSSSLPVAFIFIFRHFEISKKNVGTSAIRWNVRKKYYNLLFSTAVQHRLHHFLRVLIIDNNSGQVSWAHSSVILKRHNQVRIIKKSAFLFWLLRMTIWCKHVQRLDLRIFLIFCAAHLQVNRQFLYFLSRIYMSKIKNCQFRLFISRVTGNCATQKFEKLRPVYGHVHIISSY